MNQNATPDKMTSQEIAAAIDSATNEVFATMLDLKISSGEIQTDTAASSRASGVVALLGLAGEWVGTGRICCTPEFGCKMASQLLMQSYDAVNEDVLDAIGEVANMIIGNVKNALEERLGVLSLSTPTVIYGHNFEARSVGIRERITVDFESGSEKLQVQISISPATAKPMTPRSQVHEAIPVLAQ
jgi:chemotaxis protein CheX